MAKNNLQYADCASSSAAKTLAEVVDMPRCTRNAP